MRIWTVHPKWLDTKGLVALWREALLARKVLQGKTKGWKNHPQLDRFKSHKNPVAAINTYLLHVYKEACSRGYCFDKRKIGKKFTRKKVKVSKEFLEKEIKDLKRKLRKRDVSRYRKLLKEKKIELNPVFIQVS